MLFLLQTGTSRSKAKPTNTSNKENMRDSGKSSSSTSRSLAAALLAGSNDDSITGYSEGSMDNSRGPTTLVADESMTGSVMDQSSNDAQFPDSVHHGSGGDHHHLKRDGSGSLDSGGSSSKRPKI